MEKFVLNLNDNICSITIGQDVLKNLINVIENNNCFFVIDKFVYEKFYSTYFEGILSNISLENIYLFECNEKNKDIHNALSIIEKLNQRNYLRDTLLIGIGGGIIGDVVGFVSSIYMRGIPFINIPTTLLSQVDSSIGGKNALNIYDCKNLIGTFNHPREVIVDIKFLNTISRRELISGLAEVIKYGVVFDYEFLKYIKNNLEDILNLNREVIENIVIKSCFYKKSVVEKDERDFRLRKVLNYGHTIGHALESLTKYSLYTHGEAVLIGMFYEACISYGLGFIEEVYFKYITNFFKIFKIEFNKDIFHSNLFYETLLKDKKNRDQKVSFILPVGYSKVLEYMFTIDEIKKIDFYKYCF